MVFNFTYMKVHNFLSFHDAEIHFTNTGFTLVSGKNVCSSDNTLSNGSGKSSLWEALVWCLCGKTLRQTRDVVNTEFDDGCFVDLIFEAGDDVFRLIRSKDHILYKTNLKIYINEEDKSGKGIRDSENLLQEYLPSLSENLIKSVIVLGQGMPKRFSGHSPLERKQLLEELSGSSFMANSLESSISSRKDIISSSLSENKQKLSALSAEDAQRQETISSICDRIAELGDTDELLFIISNKEKDLEVLRELLQESQEKQTQIKSEIEEHDNFINQADSQKELELNSTDIQDARRQVNELNDNLSKLQAEQRYVKNEIIRLDSVTDICPTCKQKLPNMVKVDTTELKEHLNELAVTIKEETDKLDIFKRDLDSKTKEVESSYQITIKEVKDSRNVASVTLSEINSKILSTQSQINKIESEISTLKSRIEFFEEQRQKLTSWKEKETKLLDEVKSNLQTVSDIVDELTLRSTVIQKISQIVNKQYKVILLQDIVNYMDCILKEYCNTSFPGINIQIVCSESKIDILYNNKCYENLSGGERQKVDILIQFAIREMLCKFANFESNILVLDEIFDNLDAKGCDDIVNFLINCVHSVESIYVISHHVQDLQIPCDHEIIVCKEKEGDSRLNVI